jgi:hypothetical protein
MGKLSLDTRFTLLQHAEKLNGAVNLYSAMHNSTSSFPLVQNAMKVVVSTNSRAYLGFTDEDKFFSQVTEIELLLPAIQECQGALLQNSYHLDIPSRTQIISQTNQVFEVENILFSQFFININILNLEKSHFYVFLGIVELIYFKVFKFHPTVHQTSNFGISQI